MEEMGKVLFAPDPGKNRFGWGFHAWNTFLAMLPPAAVVCLGLYAGEERKRMEAEFMDLQAVRSARVLGRGPQRGFCSLTRPTPRAGKRPREAGQGARQVTGGGRGGGGRRRRWPQAELHGKAAEARGRSGGEGQGQRYVVGADVAAGEAGGGAQEPARRLCPGYRHQYRGSRRTSSRRRRHKRGGRAGAGTTAKVCVGQGGGQPALCRAVGCGPIPEGGGGGGGRSRRKLGSSFIIPSQPESIPSRHRPRLPPSPLAEARRWRHTSSRTSCPGACAAARRCSRCGACSCGGTPR